jgi:hypothetical protein
MANEISRAGKIIAGLILILLTTASIIAVIGYWPDKLPVSGSKLTTYSNKLFHVRLLDSEALARLNQGEESQREKAVKIKDSAGSVSGSDSGKLSNAKDSIVIADSAKNPKSGDNTPRHGLRHRGVRIIDLNTLLLLLVAVGGFLGNMIHISTSFTTFIGAEKFKRSWMLWYCVKPFTASALSVTLYFAFRAGFLNYSSDASNINLYGVMTLAILAGLFTDIATQKLKEIFQVAFNPKDERPNKLNGATSQVTEITPDKLDKTAQNTILIKGTNLDQAGLTFKINSEVVQAASVLPNLVTIQYTEPASQTAATSFKLEIFNQAGDVIKTQTFSV